jgi:hypothetical protein
LPPIPIEHPQPPEVAQSQDCGVEFDPGIGQQRRQSICHMIAANPDLRDTVHRVEYDPGFEDAKGYGSAWGSMDGIQKRMVLYGSAATEAEPRPFEEAHEMAHSKAAILFGSSTPPPSSEIYRAMESEKAGVREYSYADKAEQFADVYAASVNNDPRLDQFPRTKAEILRLRNRGSG